MTTTMMVRASQLVPGLRLSHTGPDDDQWLEPLTVVAVEPFRAGELLVTLDGHPGAMLFDEDTQVELVCAPAEHPSWCVDPAQCERDRDVDGTVFHSSFYEEITADAEVGPDEIRVGMSRTDDPDGQQGETRVHLIALRAGADLDLTPAGARELGRLLLDYADQAQPEYQVPTGEAQADDTIRRQVTR